jgi:hypothetical protein
MRVIFLDVDGVLNNRASMIAGDTMWNVDPECVQALNRICADGDAVCVLSSTWRQSWPIIAFQQFLCKHGFTGITVDRTPIMHDEERGVEIASYISNCADRGYPLKSWVILDDDADMGPLLPFLVQTKNEEGLTMEHVEKALAILNQ